MEDPKTYPSKDKKKPKVRMRFFIHNNDNRIVQVTLWNQEVERFRNIIKLGHVSLNLIILNKYFLTYFNIIRFFKCTIT